MIYRLQFKPFVIGQPNEIQVKLYTDIFVHHSFQHKTLKWLIPTVHLTTESDIYPARINIDFKTILRRRKFSLHDLQNILPKGLNVDRNKHKNIHETVVKVSIFYM
jgi:hypothetical protein